MWSAKVENVGPRLGVIATTFLMAMMCPAGAKTVKTAKMSGEQAKAISVAVDDFEKRLRADLARGQNETLTKHALNIWNFDVTAKQEEDGYCVVFGLRRTPGIIIAGGNATYQIGSDHQIKSFRGEK